MPIGLIVMRWDERTGTEVLAKFPEEISITDKTLMQVYSTHEYSGEMGMISLMVGSLNIASYYTGIEKSLYVLLLLSLDDDPDAYEGGLADTSRVILQALGNQNDIVLTKKLLLKPLKSSTFYVPLFQGQQKLQNSIPCKSCSHYSKQCKHCEIVL